MCRYKTLYDFSKGILKISQEMFYQFLRIVKKPGNKFEDYF